ncbi:MAG: hypothetical protein AB1831_08310 [Pseudomonadota bacterium]
MKAPCPASAASSRRSTGQTRAGSRARPVAAAARTRAGSALRTMTAGSSPMPTQAQARAQSPNAAR